MTKYKVNWDNGSNACGTFPYVFDTEAQAQEFADNWASEMNAEAGIDPDDEDSEDEPYSAEPIEVEDQPEPDEEELFQREAWE